MNLVVHWQAGAGAPQAPSQCSHILCRLHTCVRMCAQPLKLCVLAPLATEAGKQLAKSGCRCLRAKCSYYAHLIHRHITEIWKPTLRTLAQGTNLCQVRQRVECSQHGAAGGRADEERHSAVRHCRLNCRLQLCKCQVCSINACCGGSMQAWRVAASLSRFPPVLALFVLPQ